MDANPRTNNKPNWAKMLLLSLFLGASQLVLAQAPPDTLAKAPLQQSLIVTGYGNVFPASFVWIANIGVEYVIHKKRLHHMFGAVISDNGYFGYRPAESDLTPSPYLIYGLYFGQKQLHPEINVGAIWLRDMQFINPVLYPILTAGLRYQTANSPLMIRAGFGTGGFLIGLGWKLNQRNDVLPSRLYGGG